MRKRRKMGLDAKALDIGHPLSNNTNDEDPQKQIQIQIQIQKQKQRREALEVFGPKVLDRELTMEARNPRAAGNARVDQVLALNRDSHAVDAMILHVRALHVWITLVLLDPEMFVVHMLAVVGHRRIIKCRDHLDIGQVLAQALDQFMAQRLVQLAVHFTGVVARRPHTCEVQVRGTRPAEAILVGQSLATARFRGP